MCKVAALSGHALDRHGVDLEVSPRSRSGGRRSGDRVAVGPTRAEKIAEWARVKRAERELDADYRAVVERDGDVSNAAPFPSPDEVVAAQTPGGGWSRATLAEWGVPWPPPKGLRRVLEFQWERTRALRSA